jgi:hypothetical protein
VHKQTLHTAKITPTSPATLLGANHHHRALQRKQCWEGPNKEHKGCRTRSNPCRTRHGEEILPHFLQRAKHREHQGNVFKKSRTLGVWPPCNPRILGFHPEHIEAAREAINRLQEGDDVPTSKGFPSAKTHSLIQRVQSVAETTPRQQAQNAAHRHHTVLTTVDTGHH